jgi:hypothetical protein
MLMWEATPTTPFVGTCPACEGFFIALGPKAGLNEERRAGGEMRLRGDKRLLGGEGRKSKCKTQNAK